MGFSLKNWAEEAQAQFNPFDKGKTAATVRAKRKAPPARLPNAQELKGQLSQGKISRDQFLKDFSKTTNLPARSSVLDRYSLSNIGGAVRDIPKNITRPEAKIEIGQGVKNPVARFGGKLAADFINSPMTISSGVSRVKRGDVYGGGGEIVKGLIEGPAGLLPVGRVAQAGAKSVGLGAKVLQGAKTGVKTGAAFGGAYGGAEAMSRNARPKEVLTTALVGAGLGAGAGGALGSGAPLVGAGVRLGAKGAKAAPKAVQNANPQAFALNQSYKQLQRSLDTAKGANNVKAVRQSMLANRAEYRRVSEGGFVQAPTKTRPVEVSPPRTQTRIAEPPLPPVKAGIQIAAPPPQGPKASLQLPGGKSKATKFASKTVPESEFVSEPIKGSIKAPEYSPQAEKQGYAHALGKLKSQGDEAFENEVFTNLNKKSGTISRQEAINATTHAQLLDSQGGEANIRKATEIYEKLSDHYTSAGQTIQVGAILARRTPQGMRGWATSTLKKAGVEPSSQLQAQIVDLAQKKDFAGLADLVSKSIPSSRGDKIINAWRAGLLTAPTTTGGNLLGNTGEALVRKGFVNPVASFADLMMSGVTGKRTMTLGKPGQYASGFKQGAKEFGKGVDSTKYDVQRRTNYNTKALDTYVNGVYKLMGVADLPFSKAAEKEALSSIAKAEAINQGLKGSERAKFIKNFMDNPSEQAKVRSQTEGDFAVFKDPTLLGKAAGGLKKPLGPVGDFIVPFTQVPASIATRIVKRTPIGTAQEVIKQIKHIKSGGEFDQRAMSQAIGNGAFGPAIIGAGYALANSDLLTFGYPTDKKERALFEEQGKQPYSVRIGDRWYSLNYLQPFGALLAVGGQAAQAAKEGGDITEIVGQGVATAAQSITNQSFLKGVSGVLGAVSDPERNVRKYVEQTTSSVIPNFAKSFARATDPIQRAPEGVVEGVKSGIPGLRGQTTPKYSDITGKPLPAKDTAANQYLNPLRPSIARDSKLTSELSRLQGIGEGVIPTQSNKNVFGKDSGISKKQINEMNSHVAQGIAEEWQRIINDPRYSSLSDADKQKTLSQVNSVVGPAIRAAYAADQNFINDKWEPDLNKKSEAYLGGAGVDFLASADKSKSAKTKASKPKKVAKGGKGGRKKKASKFDYRLFELTPSPVAFSKSLRQLVEEARVKA